MKTIFLLLIAFFSIDSYSEEANKIWQLELQMKGEKRRLIIELTNEVNGSCLIGNTKKVKTLEGKVPTSKYFSGYSYSIEGGVLSIDMFPRLCDGGNLLRGKIEGNTITGKIFSSSIAGLRNIGSFKGKTVEKKP